ncbi:glycoside hydrolase family 3 C-terminal domain-containing protein [Paenibacillus sp. N4]|uniref:glycoside hydrolase family 3 protein n=1 Tax=Paenibacillus vietnamensis TaxID=2590547 RepID=UPI001CD11ABB|nr:glycoside hydrolase family 3 N-terminal domain-containing protein [Paenibacillus vietnamensis]MCA0755791.1 glycoside hydrolase family 3 C-terminal domain-containing protein [Paenibacillus vietnamensis]
MQQTNKSAGIRYVHNANGPRLGYSEASGVRILEADGLFFKDLDKDGKLNPYEDWRLPADERAKDLASRMSIEQIAGLMLYSSHQAIPGNMGWFPATYHGGKPFEESGAEPGELSDQQLAFLKNDHIRHILVTRVQSPEIASVWNNNVQAFAEGIGLGIPANNSSDPRHGSDTSKEFNAGAGGTISMWPESMGLAATFDPETARLFGEIASKEYRALGLATALSPQIDIATDPRWFRFGMTFGEDPQLAADMARAYVDGFQTSEGQAEIADGWGYDSVNAMVKHWPGGGSGEAGRDAHFGYGKYAVYPGGNFDEHLVPFTEGAFRLEGATGKASAVMPYYTISALQDPKNGENVGNSYNTYLINDLLREKYGYDGVVCTDWGITADEGEDITQLFPGGRCWGVEEGYTVAERHYKLLMAGVDQFGGNNEIGPVIEAYNIGVREHGEAFMRRRFEQSAVRLLLNMFRLGLFEDPYLQAEETAAVVGCSAFMEAGYEVQLRSVVLLKNEGALPLPKRKSVYIPKRKLPADTDWMGAPIPASEHYPVNLEVVRKYYEVTDRPEEADFALVCMESPRSTKGYSKADVEAGGNGYVPISLQYGPYTAEHARETSLAGDPRDVLNRSYKGKTVTVSNAGDLETVLETKRLMGGKPVVVSILLSNPAVVAEFEREADAIVAHFGVQDQAVLDILSGAFEPQALLPFQLPAHMRTVEEQLEDVPHDMEVYVDSAGHAYDFAFGLNWRGAISDARTAKYGKIR